MIDVSLPPMPERLAGEADATSYTFVLGPHAPELAARLASPLRACTVVGFGTVGNAPDIRAQYLELYKSFADPTIPLDVRKEACRALSPAGPGYIGPVVMHLAAPGITPVMLDVSSEDKEWRGVARANLLDMQLQTELRLDAPNDALRVLTEAALRAGAESNEEREVVIARQLIALADPAHRRPPARIGAVLDTNHIAVPQAVHAAGFAVSGEYVGVTEAPYNGIAYRQIKAGNLATGLVDRILLQHTFDAKNTFLLEGSAATPYQRHSGRMLAQTIINTLTDRQVASVLEQLDRAKLSDKDPAAKQKAIKSVLKAVVIQGVLKTSIAGIIGYTEP